MTNVDELFNDLILIGQHPKEKADTVTVMENIGHFLDEENEMLYNKFKELGDIAVQYDTGHASLPWAGIRFILQVT